MGTGNLEGKGAAHVRYRDTLPKCAKMAEQIKMPFVVWTHVGPRKHVLDGGTLAPPGKYD